MKKKTAWLLTALAAAALVAFLSGYFYFRSVGGAEKPAQGTLVLREMEAGWAA